jgi:hypothetical protein
MLVAPRRFDPESLPKSGGKLDCSGIDLLALYPEVTALEELPQIRALILGRKNMELNGEWIEVKHVGDAASTMKTRINTMSYRGVVQQEAKTGTTLDDDETLDALHARPDIPVMLGKHLPSPHEFYDGVVQDYVNTPTPKRANTDYDYKRMLLDDRSTRPFADKAEFQRVRQTASNIRKERVVNGEKVPGKRATPERVLLASKGMRLRAGETLEDGYRRYVHWAVARGEGGWAMRYVKHVKIAAMLGIDHQAVFKNYRRRQFEPQKFPWSELFEKVMREVAGKLNLYLTPGMRELLCSPRVTDRPVMEGAARA